MPQRGYAILAGVLLVGLVAGLVLAWRWFVSHRATLIAAAERLWRRIIDRPMVRRLKLRYPRAWSFLAARFARGEYLGLHLTIGFLLSAVGLWVFLGVTEDVIHNDPLTQFDLTLLNWLQAHHGPASDQIFRAISALGSPLVLITLALGVALFLGISKEGLLLEGWLLAFLGGALLNNVLKSVIHRPRPYAASASLSHSWSFPSGHAMVSLIAYGMLTYLLMILGHRSRRARLAIVGCATLLVLAIGFSRLYLGAHYFSDVVGGYAAGMLWLSACISGLEVTRRRPAT
jgi:undecaprenyl-diphosphatase